MSAEYCRGYYTPPPKWNSTNQFSPKNWMSEEKKNSNFPPLCSNLSPSFHVIHKIPSGDSPYVRAKHVQLIEKDPSKAVALFWNAINLGDRIDSALKDMAIVMKQLDRSNEAIEAIKSFRHLCSSDTQESLDNVLLELYKRSGRLEEQIEVLQQKLKRVEDGTTFGGKKVKLARCHGKKVHITVEQEYARLLGNMAWAYLQQSDYRTAEEYYRKALSIEPDKNKQCNLAICLMCTDRIAEAKILLQVIRASCPEGQMDESYGKSFERASELLAKIEHQPDQNITFTPHKKLSDNPVFLKDRAYYSVDSHAKQTYTPSSAQALGIPNSPCTQPKRTPSSLLDCGRSKKETCRNKPVTCLPRKLQFENTTDMKSNNSDCEQHNSVHMNMSIDDATPVKEVLDISSGNNNVDRKENLVPTESEQHCNVATNMSMGSCAVPEEWMFPSNKVEKSWADMVEEDEQEMKQYLLSNQQQRMEYSRSNRLQVFQDITPESPRA